MAKQINLTPNPSNRIPNPSNRIEIIDEGTLVDEQPRRKFNPIDIAGLITVLLMLAILIGGLAWVAIKVWSAVLSSI